jgi:hypothetical protein
MRRQPELDFYFSGNQPRGGRGTPTNSNSVTPVAIVTAKEEHSSQPVVANLAALPTPATNAVLPDSQPLTTVSELPVSWSDKFNAILVLRCMILKMSIVLLFSVDAVNLACHILYHLSAVPHQILHKTLVYLIFKHFAHRRLWRN